MAFLLVIKLARSIKCSGVRIVFPAVVFLPDLLKGGQPRLVGLDLPVSEVFFLFIEPHFADNFFDGHDTNYTARELEG